VPPKVAVQLKARVRIIVFSPALGEWSLICTHHQKTRQNTNPLPYNIYVSCCLICYLHIFMMITQTRHSKATWVIISLDDNHSY